MGKTWESVEKVNDDDLNDLSSWRDLPPMIGEPCSNCGKNPAKDCNYGVFENTTSGADFDCTAPDGDYLECPCYHTWCDECSKEVIVEDGRKLMINSEFMEFGKKYYFEYQDWPMRAIRTEFGVDLFMEE